MARGLVVGFLVAAAAFALFSLVSAPSDETCKDGEIKLDGDCAAVRPGTPAGSASVASSLAFTAMDEDPPADSLFMRCAFQGVAREEVDVYLCVGRYHKSPITLRMLHDRDGSTYRWTVLSDPQRTEFSQHPQKGDSGTCDPNGNPRCG